MSDFQQIEREEIAVQFVRVPDGFEHIRRAWDELEAVVPLRGRHFYGAFDPVANDYRACVEVRKGDDLVADLESGALPGGRYLRARLRGDPPAVYERIGPSFDELIRHTRPDESRPSLEHYRRHDEIDLLLPI
jgi:integron-associated effector binding protein